MRVLLIGCGRWGAKIAERLYKLSSGDLLIADLRPEAFSQIDTMRGGEYPISFYPRYEAVLGQDTLHACVVATPPDTHYEIAKACLEAGKHVLVEKPLALKGEHARELFALAEKQDLVLMVDDTWRYHSAVWDLLSRPRPGQHPNFANFWWGNSRKEVSPEGLLWTLGPHPVSLMVQFLRQRNAANRPVSVAGHITPRLIQIDYRWETGGAFVWLSWASADRLRQFELLWLEEGHQAAVRAFFDDRAFRAKEDPLECVCRKFLERAADPVRSCRREGWAVNVVEILEWTEKELTTVKRSTQSR